MLVEVFVCLHNGSTQNGQRLDDMDIFIRGSTFEVFSVRGVVVEVCSTETQDALTTMMLNWT
jgi:hypothetical protein